MTQEERKRKNHERYARLAAVGYFKRYAIEHRERIQAYRAAHKAELDASKKRYQIRNKAAINAKARARVLSPEQKAKKAVRRAARRHDPAARAAILAKGKAAAALFRAQHPDKIVAYRERRKNTSELLERDRELKRQSWARVYPERMKNDPAYRIARRVGANIRSWIKTGGGVKQETALELVGCTWRHLRKHLESTFTEGMGWDRLSEIDIDHIKPKCSFDMRKLEDRKACWHFSNLRCLWHRDNLKKGQEDRKLSLRLRAA